ncbi:YHS domain-containing protein [Clostridium kluyveri]|uniref:TRASH domain-containing protein n=1 Tax=Clostridium kluyveri TaxID=1534 RepID=A0A1L5F7V1_CLOKL|nr:YHS domain-containing protein [Clostridium kluyveri]APM38890.1 hypothetical protein BS101_09070 [Clostridium kluyveri]UZQ51209.1 YHS domain-containing protein [Clostridium kluyveri]
MEFLANNWFYFLIFGVMIYMMSKGGGCCGGGHTNHNGYGDSHEGGCCGGGHVNHKNMKKDYEEHSVGYIENSVDMARDPVCGMYVSKKDALCRVINGRTYYFCSQNCADRFERKYVMKKEVI